MGVLIDKIEVQYTQVRTLGRSREESFGFTGAVASGLFFIAGDSSLQVITELKPEETAALHALCRRIAERMKREHREALSVEGAGAGGE